MRGVCPCPVQVSLYKQSAVMANWCMLAHLILPWCVHYAITCTCQAYWTIWLCPEACADWHPSNHLYWPGPGVQARLVLS